MEVYGAACKELHDFIGAVAAYKAERSAGTWRKSSVIDWWRKRVSVALQAATSAAVDTSLRKAKPAHGYDLYTSVHLLVTPAPPPLADGSGVAPQALGVS